MSGFLSVGCAILLYTSRDAPARTRKARVRGVSTSSEDRWQTTTAPTGAQGATKLRRPGHHRPRGTRGRPQAPGHVHRLDRAARSAPPRLRGRRQLRRRGARRPLQRGHGHDPPGQLGHRRRRRPRDPGRGHGEGEAPGGRGRADGAARRRQVRRGRRLQGLRRSARRRRVGRQRALRASRRRGPPRRLRVDAVLRARQAARRPEEGRADDGDRHDDHVPARRRHLRDARLRLHDARGADARDRVPDPRACRSRSSTSAARATEPSSSTRAGSSTSSPT